MICTFYSYKGGVGRSMALANVADILSRHGLRVLMIDFDLEAPGLEQFFYRDDERDKRDAIRRQSGLLDLLLAYKDAMSVSGSGDGFRQLDRYIASIFMRRPGGGRLDLLPAGRRLTPEQLDRYALALRSFDWQDFYFNWEGDLFFEWLRRALAERYDLVLVDSRTGVTEMGGICGYQLADLIVMLCGANHQNLDGTASMLDDFRWRAHSELRRGRPLQILVVPARVEQQSQRMLDGFYTRFEQRFAELLPARIAAAGLGYRDLAIPYDPLFAFEERVARGSADQAARERLAGVFGKLADVVAVLSGADAEADSPMARAAREAASRLGTPVEAIAVAGAASEPPAGQGPAAAQAPAPAHYDETKRFADFDVMLDYARSDESAAAEITRSLRGQGLRVYASAASPASGGDAQSVEREAIAHSRVLAVLIGRASPGDLGRDPQRPGRAPQRSASLDPHRRTLLESALQARAAGRRLPIVPVLLPGCPGEPLDPLLSGFRQFDLRGGVDPAVLEQLGQLLRAEASNAAGSPPQAGSSHAHSGVEMEARCPWIGLAPIEEHRSDLLLGRDSELAALLDSVESHALTLIVGPSACGKTSLLRAGLLPMLRRKHPDWRIGDATDLPDTGAPEQRRLTIFDDLQRSLADGRIAFDGPLAARFRERVASGDRLVLSLRSEQLPAWREAIAGMESGQVRRLDLDVPDETALRQIVERPADAAGLAFEPGLVDRIVSRAAGERGVLPFLQLTLQRLWEQRRDGWLTNAAYDGFSGIRGIVSEVASRHFDALTEARQSTAKRILLRLVAAPREGRRAGAARLPYLSVAGADAWSGTIASNAGPGELTERSMLADLVDARLLATSLERDEPMVEPAHESLARDWPRMQLWLEQEREFLAWQSRLSAEIETWNKAGRPADQLLRGAALDEAVAMAAGHPLAADEDEFIAASVTARQRRADELEQARRRRLKVLATTSVLFLAIALVAGAGWVQKYRQSETLAQQNSLLQGQFDGLTRARQDAEQQRDRTLRQLAELQKTLDQALASTRALTVSAQPPSQSVTEALVKGTAAGVMGSATGSSASGAARSPPPVEAAPPAPVGVAPQAPVVEQLERAREQAGRVAEYQADYSAAQIDNIKRQQEALRPNLPARQK